MENIRDIMDNNLECLSKDMTEHLSKAMRDRLQSHKQVINLFENAGVLTAYRKSENQLVMIISLDTARFAQMQHKTYTSFLVIFKLEELNTITQEPKV